MLIKTNLTCAFLNSRPLLEGMAVEFAVEIILPEFSKPDIPSVVLQCSTNKVVIKTYNRQVRSVTKCVVIKLQNLQEQICYDLESMLSGFRTFFVIFFLLLWMQHLSVLPWHLYQQVFVLIRLRGS